MQPFAGTDRFRVMRQIGSGGMGIVYEAFDREWDRRIALKTLSDVDPFPLPYLKDEFRALADISHPNLVQLYELIAESEQCFFTMEFIDGTRLLNYLWIGASPLPPDSSTISLESAGRRVDNGRSTDSPPVDHPDAANARFACPARLEYLHGVLRQLTEGISILHDHGKLHLDIKPGNIMVDQNGRAVLLDFGLVREIRGKSLSGSSRGGTLSYMAPEQSLGEALTPAADWYGLGATLYEVVTGRPPFIGSPATILAHKRNSTPRPPSEFVDNVPRDVEDLSLALLATAPEDRPGVDEIWRVLGDRKPHAPSFSVPSSARLETLVGREDHVRALFEAFSVAKPGRAVLAFVHGESGNGKSALVNEVLDRLALEGSALVLCGRCYEQESVPYKGFDQILDSASHILDAEEPERCAEALPARIVEAAQVFPVLRRFVPDSRPAAAPTDLIEMRKVAFSAVRDLLHNLAGDRVLVLFIDDLHWGDLDTAGLLIELLRSAGGRPMMVICAYRSEHHSRCLDALRGFRFDGTVERRDLAIRPLDLEDCRKLALRWLPAEPESSQLADWIATESGGNPFFVRVLSMFVAQRKNSPAGALLSGTDLTADLTIQNVLWRWFASLPPAVLRVLETIAVSGHPISHSDALAAASVERDPSLLARLRAARVVRSTGLGPRDAIDVYHDRIREAILGRLDDSAIRDCHRSLADTLSKYTDADPERLAVHYHGAGDIAQAGHWYVIAADRAAAALAFDRACALYRKALEVPLLEESLRLEVQAKLADAFANAGRGPEAARQYLAICDRVPEPERDTVLQRAAFHFCASGYVDEGRAAFSTLLSRMGTHFRFDSKWLLVRLLWSEFRLRCRGLRFKDTPPEDLSSREAARVDALWSASIGLSMIDTAAGACLISEGALAALRLGDPARIARVLAWRAAHLSGLRPSYKSRALVMLETCRELAEQSHDTKALALYYVAAGITWLQLGNWRRSAEVIREAEPMIRGMGRDIAWELAAAETCLLFAHLNRGDYALLATMAPAMLEHAMERGNLFAATNIAAEVIPQIRLALDNPVGAHQAADGAFERWSQQGYHLQHLYCMITKANAWMYSGEPEAALEYIDKKWRAAAKSLLFRSHLPRSFSHHVRARAYMLAAERGTRRDEFLAAGVADVRYLESDDVLWTAASASLLRAAEAHLRGNRAAAISLLRSTERNFLRADMGAYLASTRLCLGRLLAGAEAADYTAQALDWMRTQGIHNPERFARVHAPGFGF